MQKEIRQDLREYEHFVTFQEFIRLMSATVFAEIAAYAETYRPRRCMMDKERQIGKTGTDPFPFPAGYLIDGTGKLIPYRIVFFRFRKVEKPSRQTESIEKDIQRIKPARKILCDLIQLLSDLILAAACIEAQSRRSSV